MTLLDRAFLVAKSQVGFEEIAGEENEPQILKYHECTDLKATDDETAWCSAFANFCVQTCGGKGTRSAAARSWLNWGRKVDVPRPGDIVVFSSPSRGPGSGHVAFFVAKGVPGFITVLGGNQSDKVCYENYPTAILLGYRRSLDAF